MRRKQEFLTILAQIKDKNVSDAIECLMQKFTLREVQDIVVLCNRLI